MNRTLHQVDLTFQTKLGTYSLATQCDALVETGYQDLNHVGLEPRGTYRSHP